MRSIFLVKLSALAMLGLCTGGVSYYLTRPVPVAATTQQGPRQAFIVSETLVDSKGDLADRPSPPVQGETISVSSASINYVKTISHRDLIAVSAAASIRDKTADNTYAWALQVVDKNNNQLLINVYENQLFRINAGQAAKPTFDEVFQTPPITGSCRIRVFVFQVPPTTGLAGLNEEEDFAEYFARDLTGAMGTVDVVAQ